MMVPTACPSSDPVKLPSEGSGVPCIREKSQAMQLVTVAGFYPEVTRQADASVCRNKPKLKMLMKYPGR